ncbi:hypothetical protein K432DRAFT_37458 [Lepidopterella palustris CBS 459.81]|uniref:Vacuolar ATPase assembly integral membrane protein VMA21 n=1 Tax=Lepidopterella palustris CBS 459.81 TaxID=1314670 RepID=A0A8E2EBE1_9PEZI|nr:hypothetical protein K432DRAFT_37458 [Lepidopterella palustris CBS 459.81]
MTSRRIISDEKTYLDKDDRKGTSEPSNISPAVPSLVIMKLLGFTFAMFTMPIGTYFLTLNLLYGGNSTFAGATAAIMANVVLIAYVLVAMKEDQSDRLAAEEKEKKAL